MSYIWDENKRLSNLEKHGIDFLEAVAAFGDTAGFTYRSAQGAAELRLVRVGSSSGRLIAVIFTERGDSVRIISASMARRNERQFYG